MSEIIISGVLKTLEDLVSSREVVSLPGYRNGVRWLIRELQLIQNVSKDAEERQYGVDTTEKWASNIRKLAYDIDDVLYTFHLEVQRKPGCFHDSVCCRVFYTGREMVKQYNMSKEIEKFRHRIEELSTRSIQYELRDFGIGGRKAAGKLSREPRRSTSFYVAEKVVGFEDETRKLLANLLKDDPQRLVISIYGTGGLGKTTLARKLYYDRLVLSRFKNRGWVCVSNDYKIRDLFLRIIKSFGFRSIKMDGLEKMTEEDLERYLFKSLQEHSYIVVIDDIREKEAWSGLKRAFPDNKNGSRVIITTRDKEVAKHSVEITLAHELRRLTQEESWCLFCEKSCLSTWIYVDEIDMQKKELCEEMVTRCNGIPLAIIVLSGMLSTAAPEQWREMYSHWQHYKADSIGIDDLFALNYNTLPYQLKPCLLYLSCFPKDFEINIEKFIHLYVAEDFIPQGKNMEEEAKGFLEELINRNLIQVGQRYWGRILTCRIHETLCNFAIEKAKDIFFVNYDEVKHPNTSPIISSCTRQVIYSGTKSSLWFQECNLCLRSLFLYDEYEFSVPMCKRFSSLRVLVDGSISNDYVTRKLIHLKYLGLKDPFIFLLPSIVFNLPRLQTLYVPRSEFPVNLPAEICKSQELRHLIGNFSCVPSSIESLTNLQTLRSITNRAWTEIKTGNLDNLRELWLGGPLKGLQVFSFDSMTNLTSLQILSVELSHDDSFGSLEPLCCCQHLVELRLRGKMESLPEEIHEVLPNLECLSLRDSRLKDDPMPLLENLPNLKILHLGYRFYSGKKIMCSANGFLQLEILLFDEHKFQIEEWQVEEGALLRLKGLRIPENFKVKIPERLRSLPTPDPREYTTKPPDDADQYQV